MEPTLPDGYVVRYKHDRFRLYPPGTTIASVSQGSGRAFVLPRGGRCEALVYKVDDLERPVAVGEAICHPRENYNKRLGRTVALGRALKALASGNPSDGWAP